MPLPSRLAGIAMVLIVAIGALSAAPATAASDVYMIEGVAVDVTADSAAEARKRAMAAGHAKAFERLMQRLLPPEARTRVATPSYDTIASLVRDFEVFDERTSSVRYLADLTFRFQPRAVRSFLRERDVPFAETRSKPLVVLALYGAAGDAVLWEGPNPWREAWAKGGWDSNGLVPYIVPLGDLGDIQAVSASEALFGDAEALERIAARHGAGDVLVTQAIPAGHAEAGTASAQVITSRVGTPAQELTFVEAVRQGAEEGMPEMLARAVRAVQQEVEEAWKRSNLLRFDDQHEMTVDVPIAGLEEWVGVRRRLNLIPAVGSSSLRRISRQAARVHLTYFGEIEQLRLALAQSDLRLAGDGTEGWTLLSSRAAGEGEGGGMAPVDEQSGAANPVSDKAVAGSGDTGAGDTGPATDNGEADAVERDTEEAED